MTAKETGVVGCVLGGVVIACAIANANWDEKAKGGGTGGSIALAIMVLFLIAAVGTLGLFAFGFFRRLNRRSPTVTEWMTGQRSQSDNIPQVERDGGEPYSSADPLARALPLEFSLGRFSVYIYREGGQRHIVVGVDRVTDEFGDLYDGPVQPTPELVETFVEFLLLQPIGPSMLARQQSLEMTALLREWLKLQNLDGSRLAESVRCMAFKKGTERCTRATREPGGLCSQHQFGSRNMWNSEWSVLEYSRPK